MIFIPVVHTAADLGSLAEAVRAAYLQHLGPTAWQQRERAVEALWQRIRRGIDALALDFAKVKIYLDGLPVCGKEEQIVRELAGAGSLNHQIVLELMDKGATLIGAEDPQLLIREYKLQHRRINAARSHNKVNSLPTAEDAELLAARDLFIANRIDSTLEEGEIGLLFLGASHRPDIVRSLGIELSSLELAC